MQQQGVTQQGRPHRRRQPLFLGVHFAIIVSTIYSGDVRLAASPRHGETWRRLRPTVSAASGRREDDDEGSGVEGKGGTTRSSPWTNIHESRSGRASCGAGLSAALRGYSGTRTHAGDVEQPVEQLVEQGSVRGGKHAAAHVPSASRGLCAGAVPEPCQGSAGPGAEPKPGVCLLISRPAAGGGGVPARPQPAVSSHAARGAKIQEERTNSHFGNPLNHTWACSISPRAPAAAGLVRVNTRAPFSG